MEDVEDIKVCKVVLLGESGVGKTSIITRYINDTFEENTMSTTGASYGGKTLTLNNGKTIKLEIWDTAGQEKYRALAKIFYKDAGIAVLVYDITRRESFEEIKKYWFNQIKEHGAKGVIIGIAGNKHDLFDREEVKTNEGENFAKEIDAVFKVTSASSSDGIEELFRELANKYYGVDNVSNSSPSPSKSPVNGQSNTEEGYHKMKLDKNLSKPNNKKKKCC